MTWAAISARPYREGLQAGALTHTQHTEVLGRKYRLKAKLETSLSCVSFKRERELLPRA